MSEMPWFKFSPKDWIEGTRDLTPEQRGIYVDCLCIMYRTERPLPLCDKRTAHRLEISVRLWRSVKAALLRAGKLKETDAGYINDRVISELGSRLAQSRVKSESAASRERKKREKFESSNENNATRPQTVQSHCIDIRGKKEEEESEERKEQVETPVPINSRTAKKATRGTRLADDWSLPEEWRQWTLTNCPVSTPEAVRVEAIKFANYWQSRSGREACKVSWFKTWQNRCLDVFGTAPIRPRSQAFGTQGSTLTSFLAKRAANAGAVQ